MTSLCPDADMIRHTAELFLDGVAELRCFVPDRYRGKVTHGGYFDDVGRLAQAIVEQNKAGAECYLTLNPVDPALLARRKNRVDRADQLTNDDNIVRRRWLLIDVDPKRPSGISSTDEEHEAALQRCRDLWKFLVEELGWPEPVVGDSGNGGHLDYAIDLPNNEESRELVKACLAALGFMFDDAVAQIDQSVFNASRISKVYGCVTRKGDSTPERPHRVSRLLHVPKEIVPVSIEQLRALAAYAPQESEPTHERNGHSTGLDVEGYLRQRGVEVRSSKPWKSGGTKWVLKQCVWCGSEDKAAVVVQFPSGAVWAKCQHDRCSGMGWTEFKDTIDPGWRTRNGSSSRQHGAAPGQAHSNPARAKKQSAPPPEPYRPFPLETLPEPVRGYVLAGAKSIGCEAAFVAMPMLAGLASASGATTRIRLKRGWSEPSVLWMATVAESGSQKTPAQNAALQPLRRMQAVHFEKYPERFQKYEEQLAIYEAEKRRWMGRRKSKKEDAGDPPVKPKPPHLPRYLCCDITLEALAVLLDENPRGVLLDIDELKAWLGSFDKYRASDKGGDVARWLSIYSAGHILVDRRTGDRKTIFVKHAAISIAGSIQPWILRQALGNEHVENGLAARLLLATPPRRQRHWNEASIHESAVREVERVYERLLELPFGLDRKELPAPVELELTPEAKALWIEFYDEHARQHLELTGPLSAAWSKLEAIPARLALVHHLVRWTVSGAEQPGIVGLESMEAGIALTRWFAYEGQRFYEDLSVDEADRELRVRAEWIQQKGGKVSVREYQQGHRSCRTAEDAEMDLQELVTAGYGEWTPVPPTNKGGRPSRVFRLSTKPPTAGFVYETTADPEIATGCVDVDSVDAGQDEQVDPSEGVAEEFDADHDGEVEWV